MCLFCRFDFTWGPGTGDLRELYKDGPLCPRREKKEREKKEREKGELGRKREDLCGRLVEIRPAAEDTEDQCKVISDGSGDF